MYVVLGDECSNPVERESANTINGSTGHNDTEAFPNIRGNSSQENEIRDFYVENEVLRHDSFKKLVEIFSNEINKRLSQEMDCLISMMHSQINRAISSAISHGVIPGIQNMMGSLSSGHRHTESGTSANNQAKSEEMSGLKTKVTKKDSRPAFDFRDTGDLSKHY